MKQKNILVIDDEENIRFTFESFLSEEGYSVKTAIDYFDALSIIDEIDFDLIFVDILLDGRSGIEILREIRNRNINCPVIVITGAPDVDTATEALRLGALDYVSKPILQAPLLKIASSALKHKQLMDEKEDYRLNLEAIFKSVKDAIITVGKDFKIIEVNDATKNICGFSRSSIGRRIDELPKYCEGKCMYALEETIKKKQPVEIYRFECKHKRYPFQVVTISTHPLFDNNGNFNGAVLLVKDETHLDDLEKKMRGREQFFSIIGKNQKMQSIYALIENLADVQTTVIITGESGTGKELVAEALYQQQKDKKKPFVVVNCAALSDNLLESELFGHVKGAYTGAVRDRKGRFQMADGGIVFLDEIGDISSTMQLRFLRVLQEMEFERVGNSTPVKVNVRVIAATNQDLLQKVKVGSFREDLYHRLKVVEINMPPLRDKREDIPLLMNHFFKMFNKKHNKNIKAISENVLNIFMDYKWPGNVRELKHTLEHAFVNCQQKTITIDHLPSVFDEFIKHNKTIQIDTTINEKMRVLQALEKTSWNKTRAARLLGISRRSVYRKMNEYKIDLQKLPV